MERLEAPGAGSVSELSCVRTAVNSPDCLPLTGVTGSLGDSLSDSVSSRIAQLRSVGYGRGEVESNSASHRTACRMESASTLSPVS